MQKTVYQVPELRDANDNIIQQGAFGKNTALSNSTNDGWIDYVMNNLEALHDVVGETSPTLDANGHVVEPANLAIGDEDGNRIKESYLKLSGGKVTGVASFRTDLRMLDNQDNRWGGLYVLGTTSSVQYLSLYGGTRATGDARLNLYNTGNGKFELTGYSTDGANAYTLTNDNNGNLNWRGYPLAWKKDYLPLVGGTMTGSIVSAYTLFAKKDVSNSFLSLCGGTNSTDGASLLLNGKDRPYNANSFMLTASDGTNSKVLQGYANGTLTWGGNSIALSKDVLPLTGGTMTGTITCSNDTVIKRNVDDRFVVIYGGSGDGKGASLGLNGKDWGNSNRNSFMLTANDGTTGKTLQGKADGTLTWNGNNVITSAGGTFNGTIISATRNFVKRSNDNDLMVVYGASSENNGAALFLFGKDWTNNNRDSFMLQAHDGTTNKRLQGHADGTLIWNGQPIQTSSDKRLKTDFSDVPDDVLEAWGKVEWQQFKYIDDAERKGVNNCRWHTGLVAQDVKEIGEENNVDLLRYGILCHDVRKATAEQDVVDLWTVRYEEALAMEAAYQRRRADRLEERIARLEALLMNTETEEE